MEQASRAWTSFKNGYISMHIDSPRWGLDALKEAVCNQEDWERLKRTFGGARNYRRRSDDNTPVG